MEAFFGPQTVDHSSVQMPEQAQYQSYVVAEPSEVQSRVTASGFTESTLRPDEMYRESQRVRQEMDEVRELIKTRDAEAKKQNENMLVMMKQLMNSKQPTHTMSDIPENSEVPAPLRTRRDSVLGSEVRSHKINYDNDRFSVIPDDSVSQIRTNRTQHFKLQDTFRPLSQINASRGGSMFDGVVAGYQQDAEQKMEELDAYTQITEVNGLNVIFTNQRLNFLAHLHTPLRNIMTENNKYPCANCLTKLFDFLKSNEHEKSPQNELLYQVIRNTISVGSNRVRANPFNIPILEPGMNLNEQVIFMAFDQLYKEFQMEWFQSMKDFRVPEFHGKYERKSHKIVTDKLLSDSPRKKSSSQAPEAYIRRKNGSRSIISSFSMR